MTVTTDVSSTLSNAVWSDEQLYLKEFVHRHPLPAVVRIVKGQYCSLGVPGGPLSGVSGNLHPNILLVGLGKYRRIIAQSVKFKDNCKVVAVGPKLAIPSSYEGYFEILNEDGKAVKCIETVADLSRRFPDSVLVRENFRAFVSKSDDLNAITGNVGSTGSSCASSSCSGESNPAMSATSRIVQAGETLILVGEVKSGGGKSYLRCLDSQGENVYLPHELKNCRFSAIAKEDNISGVHTVEKLLNKRLPLMARLANGLPPIGLKSTNHFLPELRLFTAIEEEYLVAMTLSSSKDNSQVLSVPLGAILKVQHASNISSLRQTKEFIRVQERCLSLSSHLADRIVIHDVTLANKDLRLNGGDNKQKVNTTVTPTPQKIPFTRRVMGSAFSPKDYPNNGDDYDEIEQIYDYVRGFAPLPKNARGWKYEPTNPVSPSKMSPPIKDENNVYNLTSQSSPCRQQPLLSPGHGVVGGENSSGPPEPPPLETLPSRNKEYPLNYAPQMIKPEQVIYSSTKEAKKRQRRSLVEKISGSLNENINKNNIGSGNPNNHNLTTRFMKSANQKSQHRFFRKHSMKDSISSSNGLCSPSPNMGGHGGKNYASPMFQMRYKSLTNLATPLHHHTHHCPLSNATEYDTLDSSNSGGKTSGESSSSANRSSNLPEKRSRRGNTSIMHGLSRPKSLTNLVWGGLGGSTTSINLRGTGSRQNLLNMDPNGIEPDYDRQKRLEPGVYGHYQPATHHRRRLSRDNFHVPGPVAAGNSGYGKKLGSKRIGTLYL